MIFTFRFFLKCVFELLLLNSFLDSIASQAWLNVPKPRGYQGNSINSASTSSPCGSSGTFPSITQVENIVGVINTQWEIESESMGSNSDVCSFALSLDVDNAPEFEANVIATGIPCASGSYSYNLTMYSPWVNTTVYLQFIWENSEGTRWYSCAQLSVSGSNFDIKTLSSGETLEENVSANSMSFYQIEIPAEENVYVEVNELSGDKPIQAAIGFQIPTLSSYFDMIHVSSSFPGSLSICGQMSPMLAYIVVFASSACSYSINPTVYNGEIFYANSTPQVTSSLPQGGGKFYYTLAYDTYNSPKIALVKKTSGSSSILLYLSLVCIDEDWSSTFSTGEFIACLDLGSSTYVKYIQVVSADGSPISFQISVEQGTCATYITNGSNLLSPWSSAVVPLTVLALSWVFLK